MRLRTVVLPEPFGPMRPVMPPAGISKERSRTAMRPPKAFPRPWTLSMAPRGRPTPSRATRLGPDRGRRRMGGGRGGLLRRRGAGRAPSSLARAGEHAVELLDPGRDAARDKIDDYDETDAERDGEVSRKCAYEKIGQKDQQHGADRGAPRPARTAEQGGDQHLE